MSFSFFLEKTYADYSIIFEFTQTDAQNENARKIPAENFRGDFTFLLF